MFLARSAIWDICRSTCGYPCSLVYGTCLNIDRGLPDNPTEQHFEFYFLHVLLSTWWSDVGDGTVKSEHCAARNGDRMENDNPIPLAKV